MPRVPGPSNVLPFVPQGPQPSPTELAMAAATMHEEGRLFVPPQPKASDDRRK